MCLLPATKPTNRDPAEHPVLLTEAPLNARRNREETVKLFFEGFGVPALFVSMQAVLSLYSLGRTTGLVLDSGDGATHAVPVYEGFAVAHGVQRTDVAGRAVTRHLQQLLRKEGAHLRTSAELEIVRTIKETACRVAFDPRKEEAFELERGADPGHYVLPDGTVVAVRRGLCVLWCVVFVCVCVCCY